MPAGAVGAALGFTLTCWKNGLCMMPWYRKPWEHVACMTLGAFATTWVVAKEDELISKIEGRYARLAAAHAERQ